MNDIAALLTEPTPRAARAVALGMLDAADAARVRLADPGDDEALHDFRVALRRLRSWLRAYRRELRDGIGGKAEQSVRDIAAATTESRDLQVHLDWLARQQRTVPANARGDVARLIRALRAAKVRADSALRSTIAGDFPKASAWLRKKLVRYPAAVHGAEPGERWAVTAAARVHDAFLAFRKRFAAIAGEDDDRAGHRARVAAKRLRYLLEPLDGAVDGVHDAVETLKVVQDRLGAIHDAHVFTRTIRRHRVTGPPERNGRRGEARKEARPRDGIEVLAARLARRRAADWRALSGEWAAAQFPALADCVHRIVQGLRDAGGAGVEIERKYLLRSLPQELAGATAAEIEQGYLPGRELVERLRRTKTADGVTFLRTVKSGAGIVRTELEEECSRDLFDAMWPFTKGRRLRKRRYRVADAGHTWEIDEFTDRPLVLAEIELTSAREEVHLPEWLTRCVEREVTDDPDYLNVRLAR